MVMMKTFLTCCKTLYAVKFALDCHLEAQIAAATSFSMSKETLIF